MRNVILPMLAILLSVTMARGEEVLMPDTVTASSELTFEPGHLARVAADGKTDGSYWCTDFKGTRKDPHWLEFSFDEPRPASGLRLYFLGGKGYLSLPNAFRVRVRSGASWETVAEETGYRGSVQAQAEMMPPNPVYEVSFERRRISAVRLEIMESAKGIMRLNEMQVFDHDPVTTVLPVDSVRASSELTQFRGHLAKMAIDGVKRGNQYWCTDFQHDAKPPHWLELDFGTELTVARVELVMCQRYDVGSLLNTFSIQVPDGDGGWRTVAEERDYLGTLKRVSGSDELAGAYASVPGAVAEMTFEPVRTRRLRLVIPKTGIARVVELSAFSARRSADAVTDTSGASPVRLQAQDGVYAFDFGTEESPVLQGFLPVTSSSRYAPAVGYGWSETTGLHETDRSLPDDLRRDFVVGFAPGGASGSSFRIDLPRGSYLLHLVTGDFLLPTPAFRVGLGQTPLRQIGTQHVKQFYPETDVVEVGDDGLVLTFEAERAWLVGGLLIAPLERHDAFDKAIDQLLTLPDESTERSEFKPLPEPTNGDGTVPAAVANDGAAAYLFGWTPTRRLYQAGLPAAESRAEAVFLAATPGETEPASFAVHAQRDLRDLAFTLGPQTNRAGEILPVEATRYRVRCWPQRAFHKGSSLEIQTVPELLDRLEAAFVAEGRIQQFWITLRIPEAAAAGEYAGEIAVTEQGREIGRLPLNIRVYPFRLDEPAGTLGIYEMPRQLVKAPYNDEAEMRAHDLKVLRDMRAHGMNSIVLYADSARTARTAAGRPDLSEIDRWMELLDEAGFPKRPVPWMCHRVDPEVVTVIRDTIFEKHGREILFYAVDEPFNGERLRKAVEWYKEIKAVPGVRTYCTVYQNSIDTLGDLIDVRCYAVSARAKFDASRLSREADEQGHSFWWYTNAAREVPAVMRFKSGFFFWKTQATGQFYWAYMNVRMNGFNDMDGRNNDHCAVYPGPGGRLIPTIQWETMREGIDDLKYVELLTKRIAAAPDALAAKQAQAYLDALREEVHEDLAYYEATYGNPLELHVRSDWHPERYDRERARIAEFILSLSP